MELVVSENFVQLLPSSWSFFLGFEFLEFKSNNIHHRHAMTPTT